MMMNNTLRNQCNIPPGSIITGKWNKNQYKVVRELGNGANGIVYLAENNKTLFALKISDNGASIISEMNILKEFSKAQGSALGPSFVEADDWVKNGKPISFYVMEYIKGEGFLEFIQKKGPSWTGILMLQLLASLESLHKQGWVFGDLKPENLIVASPSSKVRCVDVGGTTKQGRSIKEFTEFFDRGYWGLGSRKADPKYDLFAVAMIIINSAYPARFSRNGEGYKQLSEAIMQKKELRPFKSILEDALHGRFSAASEMRDRLIGILSQRERFAGTAIKKQVNSPGKPSASSRTKRKRAANKKGKGGFVETCLLVAVVSLLYVLYIYEQFL
ncbi:protein kinase domain-containing protein [Peribacillus sp. B-H-3]|uniref:protein kinase domain-containing protein n=1 Tax=Peribacillus sp. B-H-3 TaxID=3400420 RepID=UPI003B014464